MKTHKDLDIWKRGIDFVEKIYMMTANFPKEELYGLVSQIRRAAISIQAILQKVLQDFLKKSFFNFCMSR